MVLLVRSREAQGAVYLGTMIHYTVLYSRANKANLYTAGIERKKEGIIAVVPV